MGRGKAAEVGATRVSQNGYHYTKTESGWRLTHHLTAEKMLGRSLRDDEIVKIIDKKSPYNDDNIEVIIKRTSSLRKRKAVLEAKIADMQGELDSINEQLESQRASA